MLPKFPLPFTEQQIHNYVIYWINLLANKEFQKAFDSVLHSDYFEWTPESIESVINGYGMLYEEGNAKYQVTDAISAIGKGDNFDIMWYDPNEVVYFIEGRERLAEVWSDLPLNGEWSDLTVTFDLVKVVDAVYLELKDIHVF